MLDCDPHLLQAESSGSGFICKAKGPAYHGLIFQGPVHFPLGPAFLSLLVPWASPWEWAQIRPQPSPKAQWLNGPVLPFQATTMEPCCLSPHWVVVKSSWGQMLWLRNLDGTYLEQISYLLSFLQSKVGIIVLNLIVIRME